MSYPKISRRDAIAATAAGALIPLAAVPALAGNTAHAPTLPADAELGRLFDDWRRAWLDLHAYMDSTLHHKKMQIPEDEDETVDAHWDAIHDAYGAVAFAPAESMVGVDIKLSVLLADAQDWWEAEQHIMLDAVLAALNDGQGSRFYQMAREAKGGNWTS